MRHAVSFFFCPGILTAEVNKMVSARRWWVALLVVALLLAVSAAAWLYYGHSFPKAPSRARQVMSADHGDRPDLLPGQEDNR
jgi:hypothetical protein